MTTQEIILNKDNIFLCAKAFREDAKTLMFQLSQKFDFDLNKCGEWPLQISKTSLNVKGILSDDLTFYLHGSHCRFDNLKTGQIIEVCYTEKPEFGLLEGFHFYTYMQTTDKFKNLANWFKNYSNVYYAIDILSEEGTLTKKPRLIFGDYIIAI